MVDIKDDNEEFFDMESTLFESKTDMNGEADDYVLDENHEYSMLITKAHNDWKQNSSNTKIGEPKFEVVENSEDGVTSHISQQTPRMITGSLNTSTTKSPLVQCLYSYIIKGSGFMVVGNYFTRVGKKTHGILMRDTDLMTHYHPLVKEALTWL